MLLHVEEWISQTNKENDSIPENVNSVQRQENMTKNIQYQAKQVICVVYIIKGRELEQQQMM